MRVPRLLEELHVARVQGTYAANLARYQRFELLVLDDFLMAPLADVERRDLLELLEDRYQHASTIFTSQVPTKTWHSAVGDPTIADAICDCILHNAKHITLRGESLRKMNPTT
jgi:DNA replication protein DnaC